MQIPNYVNENTWAVETWGFWVYFMYNVYGETTAALAEVSLIMDIEYLEKT